MTNSHSAEPVLTEIKVWMARRRVNQSELADALGVAQSWVSKRLAGKVVLSVGDLTEIAAALDVPAAEFFRPVMLDKRPARDNVHYRYTGSPMGISARGGVKVAS